MFDGGLVPHYCRSIARDHSEQRFNVCSRRLYGSVKDCSYRPIYT